MWGLLMGVRGFLERQPKPVKHGRREPLAAAEAYRIVCRKASLRRGPPRPRRAPLSSSRWRVLSAIATTFAGRARSVERSCSSTSSGERRHREALVVVDVALPGLVAEHERVRGASVEQAERDARVGGMEQRALALDPEQLAAAFDRPRARAARRRRR